MFNSKVIEASEKIDELYFVLNNSLLHAMVNLVRKFNPLLSKGQYFGP